MSTILEVFILEVTYQDNVKKIKISLLNMKQKFIFRIIAESYFAKSLCIVMEVFMMNEIPIPNTQNIKDLILSIVRSVYAASYF